MILRLIGVLTMVVAFMTTGSAGTLGVAEQTQDEHPAALFITLPMTSGFADATDALVETQRFVRDALDAVDTVRLVDRRQDSDAVLTVLGRGTGYDELTPALQEINPMVVSAPVILHARERYIEAMLAAGPCGDAATNPTRESKSAACYRKIFVGLGDHDVRQGVAKAAQNSWTTCANALGRDVQAWVTENAIRLLALRG